MVEEGLNRQQLQKQKNNFFYGDDFNVIPKTNPVITPKVASQFVSIVNPINIPQIDVPNLPTVAAIPCAIDLTFVGCSFKIK